MKRLCTLLVCVCLCMLTLAGCAGSASYNVQDTAQAIAQVCAIEDAVEINDEDMQFTLSIPDDLYEEYSGQRTTANGGSGTVLVVRAKPGKAEDVKAAMEAYRDGLVAQFENYKADFPQGYEQNKNGRIVLKGDYAVLAIAGADVDYQAVDQAIDDAMK